MTKKIIYIAFAPLSERIYRDWYLGHLFENEINIEYWNLAPFLDGILDEFDTKSGGFIRTFETFGDFKEALNIPENKGALCIMLMGYGGRFISIYRELSRHGYKMIYIGWGALPEKSYRRWKSRALELLRPSKFVSKLFFKLKGVAYKRCRLVSRFEAVFAAGLLLESGNYFTKRLIPINAFDYDKFIEADPDSVRIVGGPYAVFLDIFFPFQSDLKFEGAKSVNPEKYFSSLNRFFDILESSCGVKVIIASHPKANYTVNTFQGREIYYGKTAELVKRCKFVISHHSTSVNYAVLSYVPIIFIYTQEMFDLYPDTRIAWIKDIAEYLNAKTYNVDQISSAKQVDLECMNIERYECFKYTYLTNHETEKLNTREIFFDEINRLLV